MDDAETAKATGAGIARTVHAEGCELSQIAPTEHGLAIVVADRGWVFVGVATTDFHFTTIKDARCVRRWGTTEGLGELAKKGPLPNTRLDAPADTKLSNSAVIVIVPCEATAWSA